MALDQSRNISTGNFKFEKACEIYGQRMNASSRFFDFGTVLPSEEIAKAESCILSRLLFCIQIRYSARHAWSLGIQGRGSDGLGLLIAKHVLAQVDGPPPRALQHSTQRPWFFSARQSSIVAGDGPCPTAAP